MCAAFLFITVFSNIGRIRPARVYGALAETAARCGVVFRHASSRRDLPLKVNAQLSCTLAVSLGVDVPAEAVVLLYEVLSIVGACGGSRTSTSTNRVLLAVVFSSDVATTGGWC